MGLSLEQFNLIASYWAGGQVLRLEAEDTEHRNLGVFGTEMKFNKS